MNEIADKVFNHLKEDIDFLFHIFPNKILQQLKDSCKNDDDKETKIILKSIITATICNLFEKGKIILRKEK